MAIYTDMAMSRSLEILSVDATLRDCVFRSSQPSITIWATCFLQIVQFLEPSKKAYETVQCGSLSIRCATEEFGVPRSTLADCVSGRVLNGATSGPMRYLSAVKEEELVHFYKAVHPLGMDVLGNIL